jgi:hypothetical protein
MMARSSAPSFAMPTTVRSATSACWSVTVQSCVAEEDVGEVGAMLEPVSAAIVLVWENTWAAPFDSAVRKSDRQLVTTSRISAQAPVTATEADREGAAKGS